MVFIIVSTVAVNSSTQTLWMIRINSLLRVNNLISYSLSLIKGVRREDTVALTLWTVQGSFWV